MSIRLVLADDHPVVLVSWQQAIDFCDWLSKKEGRPYRLPTEAEWEYACRAETTTPYHTGETLTPEQANFGVVPQGKRPGPVVVGAAQVELELVPAEVGEPVSPGTAGRPALR